MMPRFSLGSPLSATRTGRQNTQQQQQQHDEYTQQDTDIVRRLWKQFRNIFVSERDQFGDLSPEHPPLPPPFGQLLIPLGDAGTSNGFGLSLPAAPGSSNNNNSSSSINRFTRPKSKRIAPEAEVAPITHRLSADERAFHGALYTIIEESETILSLSSQTMTRPRPLSSSLEDEKLKRISITSNGTNASGDSSGSSTSSSNASYHPPPLWPSQPQKREPYFRPRVIGDEAKCRRKFVKMVQSAQKFHSEYKGVIPKEMQVVFNVHDNVQCIRLVVDDRTEDHKFCGNSQFIPPELSTHGTFNNSLVDVWVLGINLYRMLVGRYPFVTSNDRKLFRKMLSADFTIPQDCSEDAKDLLWRMLAPDTARASLDLVLHHPWLRPYKVAAPPTNTSSEEEETTSGSPDTTTSSIVGHRQQRRPATSPPPLPPLPQQRSLPPSPMPTRQPLSTGEQPRPRLLAPAVMPGQGYHVEQAKQPKRPCCYRLLRVARAMKSVAVFVAQGPYPPPSKPYREFGRPL